MDQQTSNNQFQGKWKKETPVLHKKKKIRHKRNKSFFSSLIEKFKRKFKSIKNELFTSKSKTKSKYSLVKKNDFRTLSNRSILKKAFQNSKKDLLKLLKSFKIKRKEVRRSELIIQKKIRKKKREALLNSILYILKFRFLFDTDFNKISKDTLTIGKKILKKKPENIKNKLIRYSQFRFNSKNQSLSVKLYQRELRYKRKQKIKKFISDIITFPQRSIKNIRSAIRKTIRNILNIKEKWNTLLLNISRIKSNPELKSRFVFTYFNSTLAFFTTFILIYFLNQVLTSLICSAYSIPIVLYYFDIIYQVGPYSSLWNRFNIIIIYGSAPFFSLLLSVIFYQLYKISKNKFKYLRIYFLWGMINSFNFFFGAYIVGAITRSGFIYFTEWIFFSYVFDIEEIIFMVSSLIALVSIGYFSSDFFLSSADNKELISFKNKPFYKFTQIFLPWLSGIILLLLFNLPNITVYNLLTYASLLLMVVPAMIDYNNYKTQQIIIVKSKQKYAFLKWNLIVSVIVIILIRFLLNNGIWLS